MALRDKLPGFSSKEKEVVKLGVGEDEENEVIQGGETKIDVETGETKKVRSKPRKRREKRKKRMRRKKAAKKVGGTVKRGFGAVGSAVSETAGELDKRVDELDGDGGNYNVDDLAFGSQMTSDKSRSQGRDTTEAVDDDILGLDGGDSDGGVNEDILDF